MSRTQRSKPSFKPKKQTKSPQKRDLMGVNPFNQQFEPTTDRPIRQRAKMAGA